MQKLALSLILIFIPTLCSSANAQYANEEAAVLATMDNFFTALAASDRNGLEQTTIPGSLFISASVDEDGNETVNTITREAFVNSLSNPASRRLERYWNPTVLVQENIAVFWAPYDFHVNGEFTHCGIDSFQLFKMDGVWLIGSSSYTRETVGCPQSPLGPIQ